MKTKNCRVRVKDIKQGITIFVSHPVYGINEYVVDSKPFIHKSIVYSRDVQRYTKMDLFTAIHSVFVMQGLSPVNLIITGEHSLNANTQKHGREK